MTGCVCDSGPLTHLWQIRRWQAFATFRILHIPQAVHNEVQDFVPLDQLAQHVPVQEHPVSSAEIEANRPLVMPALRPQTTDLAVLVLAQQLQPELVLTDDLTLRQELEQRSLVPMGSVGIVLRAYRRGLLDGGQLDAAIDGLFTGSTLYLSASFKSYVRRLVAGAIGKLDNDSSDR